MRAGILTLLGNARGGGGGFDVLINVTCEDVVRKCDGGDFML